MLNVLASGGLKDYFEVFEYYFSKFATNDIKPVVWLEFIVVIIVGFIIRGYLWLKVEMDKIKSDDILLRRKAKIYCFNHTGYEFIIGFIITYILINFTGANPHAFIVNAGICPGIGFMFGFLFDNKIIMKLEDSNNLFKIENDDSVKEEKAIEIIKPEIEIEDNKEGLSKININTVENCDVKLAYRLIKTINEIIDGLDNVETKIATLENVIEILKESEKTDKKAEIKTLIYQCLNEGYAKPEEDAVITNKYNSYMALVENGDNELKSLFENRYLKLGVHEDRRKNNVNVNNDRRGNKKKISYEEFNKEAQG